MKRATNKRRITPETKAGQYMYSECGKIFDTKKEVDTHIKILHNENLRETRRKFEEIKLQFDVS